MKMDEKTNPKEANHLIAEDLGQLFEKYREKDLDYASEIIETREFYLKKNYPCSVLEEKVNSVDTSIIGVKHTAEFFDEYKSFLEERISQADAVIIEDIAGGNFWEEPDFYRRIGEIVQSKQKRLFQVDSARYVSFILDLIQGPIGIGLIGGGILGALSNPDPLVITCHLAIGLYLFMGSIIGKNIVDKIKDSSNYGLTNLLLWSYINDYREIVIAGGIKKIIDKNPDLKNILCIHGESHSNPIKTYLKHPLLRKAKRITYFLPYEIISYQPIREYIPVGNGWKRKKKGKEDKKNLNINFCKKILKGDLAVL